MTDHYEVARDHLAAAEVARENLRAQYRVPSFERDSRVVAALNADVGTHMKLAEIHFAAAQVQAIREVATAIENAWVEPWSTRSSARKAIEDLSGVKIQ